MDTTGEILRLAAGIRPEGPDDAEIERIERGERRPVEDGEFIARLSGAAVGSRASQWRPSTLSGSRRVKIGKATFQIPRDAETKQSRRAGTLWVRIGDQTFILSELGELIQTPAERRSTRWDLL
jgi:hypothetical protein